MTTIRIVAFAAACFSLAAQTQTQTALATPQIDVTGYIIDAKINPQTQALSARASVTFLPLEDKGNSATFELNNALNVSAITDEAGAPLQSSRNQADNTIRVTFAGGLTKNQPATINFTYDGRLSGEEESPVYGIKFASIQNDHGFLLYPARWFPISGYTADRFTSTINVTVPQGFLATGSGKASAKTDGDQTIYSFEYAQPSFPADIAFGKAEPLKNSAGGVDTSLWFRGNEAAAADAWGEATSKILTYFTSVYGLPWTKNLTLVETDEGAPNGYAGPGMIFLAPRVISKEVNSNVLANQVARQWWEEGLSPINRNHLWIENGMALYSEALWAEQEKGAGALDARMKDASVTALTVDDVPLIQTSRLEDYSPEYWALSASKGAVVARMIRSTVGDEKFFQAIKTFLEENRFKSIATEDFRKSFEAATGEELRYFFIQWVESNGSPEFKLDYTIFRTTKGFRVQGKVSQDLDTFRMPVDLKIETEGNPEEKRIEVMGTSSEFSVDTFGKPKSVVIDPNNTVLRLSPAVRVEVAIRKGEQFVQIGDYSEAMKQYQRALDTQRNSSMAHYRVAEVFFLQHNYQSAANEFNEALNGDLLPKWVEVWAHIYRGKIFDISGQRERAVNEYTQAQRTRDNAQGAQDEVAKFLKAPYIPKSNNAV